MTTKIRANEATGQTLDDRTLRQAFGKFTTGVTIVTANIGGKPVGMTANSFSSLSLDPPLVLWSVRKSSTNFSDFMEASHFAVNVLSTAQIELSQRFAKSSTEKFSGVDYEQGAGGAPIFPETTATFECATEALHEAGDHVVMIGRVQKVTVSDHRPLAFSEGRYSATIEHPATRAARPGPLGDAENPSQQFINVLMQRAFNRMLDEMAELREEENVSINEIRILNLVSAYPGRTLTKLMPGTYMTEQAAEDATQTLIAKGYLSMSGDGVLTMTPAGRRSSERITSQTALLEAALLKDVPPIQVDLLRRILVDIIEADIPEGAATKAR